MLILKLKEGDTFTVGDALFTVRKTFPASVLFTSDKGDLVSALQEKAASLCPGVTVILFDQSARVWRIGFDAVRSIPIVRGDAVKKERNDGTIS